MRLYVLDLLSNREVEVEVEPTHTFRDLMDTVIKALDLPQGDYRLALGAKEYGPQHYDKTLVELGFRDGDRLQLTVRTPGGYLPFQRLLRRLRNEEKLLRDNGYKFVREDFYKGDKEYKKIKVPTVYGEEEIPAVCRYIMSFRALGYRLTPYNTVVQHWDHEAEVYILRYYPMSDDSRRLGAPIRVVWRSDIFHPNIAPGVAYGGTGVVCWALIKKWKGPALNLLTVVKGLERLVENPEPNDPIHYPEICLVAAEYFKKHKPPKVVVRKIPRK